jgi:SulP family sulfate permease
VPTSTKTVPDLSLLDTLAGDLRRRGVALLVARDVGQVRDVRGHESDDPALHHVYPTVQAAVDAAGTPAARNRASVRSG